MIVQEMPLASNIGYTADYEELLSECHKNNLVKAMLLMQRALSINQLHTAQPQQAKLLVVSSLSLAICVCVSSMLYEDEYKRDTLISNSVL